MTKKALFKSTFGFNYDEESINQLGYRLDSACGYLYKWSSFRQAYIFEKSFLSGKSYDEQATRYILESQDAYVNDEL